MNGLSKYYIKKIVNCFAAEMTATATARKLKINRNTVNKYFRIIREAVADYQEHLIKHVPQQGDVYYFSWHRHKGICHSKDGIMVFAIGEKEGRVFIKQEPKSANNTATLDPTIEAAKMMQRLPNNLEEQAVALAHAATMEQPYVASKLVNEFVNYAREKLAKFYGVKPEYIYLYLKELEFRFNNRNKDLARIISRILPHHSKKVH